MMAKQMWVQRPLMTVHRPKSIKKPFLAGLGYVITADSKPDYDDFGWDDYWGVEEWITWHKALKERYGLSKANEIFIEAWKKQGWFDHPYNFYKYNATFQNYLSGQGIEVGHMLSKVIVGGQNTVENVISAAETTSKMLPTIILSGVVLAGLIIYKEATEG